MPGYFEAEDSIFYPESVLSENLSSKANATDHPVEKGVAVSDHTQKLPETATIVLVVTETPLEPNASLIVRVRQEPNQQAPNPNVIQLDTTRFTTLNIPFADRPVAALNWLRRYRGERISYYSTKFPEFSDWTITSVSVTRRRKLSLEITVQLKEIRIGTSEEVAIPARKKRPKKADDKVDKGNQSVKPIPANKEKDSVALFLKGFAGLSAEEEADNPEEAARQVGQSSGGS